MGGLLPLGRPLGVVLVRVGKRLVSGSHSMNGMEAVSLQSGLESKQNSLLGAFVEWLRIQQVSVN